MWLGSHCVGGRERGWNKKNPTTLFLLPQSRSENEPNRWRRGNDARRPFHGPPKLTFFWVGVRCEAEWVEWGMGDGASLEGRGSKYCHARNGIIGDERRSKKRERRANSEKEFPNHTLPIRAQHTFSFRQEFSRRRATQKKPTCKYRQDLFFPFRGGGKNNLQLPTYKELESAKKTRDENIAFRLFLSLSRLLWRSLVLCIHAHSVGKALFACAIIAVMQEGPSNPIRKNVTSLLYLEVEEKD